MIASHLRAAHRRWGVLASALLAALAWPAAAQTPESVKLTAKPAFVVADGASTTTITAEVRDRSGRLIGDDETVHFSTTLGVIEAAARTQGGQASVLLTSPTVPGLATVTASAGHATAQTRVTFATQVITDVEEVSSIVIRADYLLFNDYEQIADAAVNVDIRVGGLRIRADRAQVDLMRNTVVAQGPPGEGALTISGGDVTLSADRLHYKWDARMGYLSGLSEPLRGLYSFEGATLTPALFTGQLAPETFFLRDLVPSPLSVRASRIVYLPGEEIQFTGAQIMLNGKRRFGLPIHVMPVGPGRMGQAQYIGVGPRGPLLDLPYYLAAGQKGTSQLRLKYNAPEGLYGATVPGMSLDLIGKYDLGGATEGSLQLTRVTSPDWGLTWAHNQTFGRNTRGYVNLDTRSGNGFSNRYAIGQTNLWHRGKGFSLSLNGTASRFLHDNANLAATVQTTAKPLPYGFSWTTGAQVSRRWVSASRVNAEGTGTEVVHETSDTQGVNARLNAPPTMLAGLRFTASIGPGLTLTDGTMRQSLLGTVGATRTLGRRGNLNLTYNYHDYGLSQARGAFAGYDKQTLTGNITYGQRQRWSVSAFATFGLEQNSRNMRLSANYTLSDQWHLGAAAGYFRQVLALRDPLDPETYLRDHYGATNFEFRVTRNLGERALSLVYDNYRKKVYLDYMPGALW